MQYQCSCWFVDCFAEQCADVPPSRIKFILCKISVPFCALPPPSGFRSIPLWLGVVGGVLNICTTEHS